MIKEPLFLRGKSFSISITRIEYNQNALGQLLDFGDVTFHLLDESIRLRQVERFRSFVSRIEDGNQKNETNSSDRSAINILILFPLKSTERQQFDNKKLLESNDNVIEIFPLGEDREQYK